MKTDCFPAPKKMLLNKKSDLLHSPRPYPIPHPMTSLNQREHLVLHDKRGGGGQIEGQIQLKFIFDS